MRCPACGSWFMRQVNRSAPEAPIRDLIDRQVLLAAGAGTESIRCMACGVSATSDSAGDDNVWVGSGFATQRVLILGESWYGESSPLVSYLPRWMLGQVRDTLFSRLHRVSGHAEVKPRSRGRAEFWNSIAFTNFVPTTLASRTVRPRAEGFAAGKPRLVRLLEALRPRAVLIIGIEQGKHSADVVRQAGIASVVISHPASYGVSNERIREGYRKAGLPVSVPPPRS